MMLERKLYSIRYILGTYTCQGGRLVRADPTDCILTDALSRRVNQLEDKIDNKLCLLDKGDAQAIEYNIFKRKLSMLRESDQTYDLKHVWQIIEMNTDRSTI